MDFKNIVGLIGQSQAALALAQQIVNDVFSTNAKRVFTPDAQLPKTTKKTITKFRQLTQELLKKPSDKKNISQLSNADLYKNIIHPAQIQFTQRLI